MTLQAVFSLGTSLVFAIFPTLIIATIPQQPPSPPSDNGRDVTTSVKKQDQVHHLSRLPKNPQYDEKQWANFT
ncbi:hypothetical protein K439DRAFT_1637085 [Ramaria rubella]|nr:hypothetical protein K439DRAFT_1637085 [Ramaria rubella]